MGPTDPEVHMLVFNRNLSLQFASTTLVLSSQILMVETLERNHLEQNHVFVWESVVSMSKVGSWQSNKVVSHQILIDLSV